MEDSTLDNEMNYEMVLDPQSKSYLKETAMWGKFLAIVGFVSVGFMMIMGVFIGTIYSALIPGFNEMSVFPMWIMSVFYIAIAALYIMPMLYLYRFSTKVQSALQKNSQTELTASFENLKSLFKFIGLMTAIMLGLYAVIIVGSIVLGSVMG